jgi:type III restriction enzyme
LCDQVAGRALRRTSYDLQPIGASGKPVKDWDRAVTYRFPPEYAHIIGVPFRMFKGGVTATASDPRERKHICAVSDREAELDIVFPNVVGYRVQHREGPARADFSAVEPLEMDSSMYPLDTMMGNAFSLQSEKLSLEHVLAKRDQEVVYQVTAELLRSHYRADDGCPEFQRFNQLKGIVQEWYDTRVKLVGSPDPGYRKLLLFESPARVCPHIMRGVMASQLSTDVILPVLNFYNPLGSTRYVRGDTAREVYPTTKSHVNLVVADTDTWEQIAAKTLEEIPMVESYVKNAFLGLIIPYVDAQSQDRQYFPDFIARCRTLDGRHINLIIEVTGMNQDKAEKRWYVENRWLSAVNAVREKHGWAEWRFIEIANDIREIKTQLIARIRETAGGATNSRQTVEVVS